MQMINGTARWKKSTKNSFSLRNHRRDKANGAERKNQWKVLFRSKGDSRARGERRCDFSRLTRWRPLSPGDWRKSLCFSAVGGGKVFGNLLLSVDEIFSQQVHYDDIIIIAEHRNFHSQLDSHVCLLFIGSPLRRIFIHEIFLAVRGMKKHCCEGNECARQVRVGSDYAVYPPNKSFLRAIIADGLVRFLSRPEMRFGGALGWPRFSVVTARSGSNNPPGLRRCVVSVSSLIAPHFQRI